jgi:hypothetical protein
LFYCEWPVAQLRGHTIRRRHATILAEDQDSLDGCPQPLLRGNHAPKLTLEKLGTYSPVDARFLQDQLGGVGVRARWGLGRPETGSGRLRCRGAFDGVWELRRGGLVDEP